MILVDTSAWVEYDRATGSPVERRLSDHIQKGHPIAVTEPIIMEVAAGAKTARREVSLRRLLGRFTLLRFESIADFDGAVHIYRACRSQGVTPRGMIDCMIVQVARRHGASLLAQDRDVVHVARSLGVGLDV